MSPALLAGGDGMHQAAAGTNAGTSSFGLGGDSPRRLDQPNWPNPARESSLAIACVS